MPSSRALICAALLAAGCGPGVNGLSLSAPPLAEVRGRVDLDSIRASAGGAPLRAALVWGAVPRYVYPCFMYPQNAVLQAFCPDPYGFVPGQVAVDVELSWDGDGSFVLPIRQAPDGEVSVGDDASRISWGSVVVAADLDADGQFGFSNWAPQGSPTDLALAASFRSILTPQQRVAFREGAFDAQSSFYPAPGCPAPPLGFSLVMTDLVRPDLTTGCGTVGMSRTVQAAPISEGEARAMACRTRDLSDVQRPNAGESPFVPDDPNPPTWTCLAPDVLALIGTGPKGEPSCPTLTFMPLKGCGGWPLCSILEWDRTAEPPEWWPCGN